MCFNASQTCLNADRKEQIERESTEEPDLVYQHLSILGKAKSMGSRAQIERLRSDQLSCSLRVK